MTRLLSSNSTSSMGFALCLGQISANWSGSASTNGSQASRGYGKYAAVDAGAIQQQAEEAYQHSPRGNIRTVLVMPS